MQRRPLEPIAFNEDDFLTPLDKLSVRFGLKSKENADVLCVQPLINFESFDRLFEMIGFQEIPVNVKGQKKLLYPKTSPEGEHPTGFLQFGAEARSKKHFIFEMGDHSTIVRFDFKQSHQEGHDESIYQLDELQLWDGGVRFDLDCEEEGHCKQIKLVSAIVSNVIQFMWSKCYQDAKKSFQTFDDVIRNLHDMSDQHEARYNAEMVEAEIAERQQRRANIK